MLHAGLDFSRKRLDVCLLSDEGEIVEELKAATDADAVARLARHVLGYGEPVRGVIESMTGARFIHDTLERFGWDVLIADAQKVKGLAPLCCKTRQDRRARPGDPLRALPRARGLAAGSISQGRARAGALSHASRQAPLDAQEPHLLDADQLRQAVPGL